MTREVLPLLCFFISSIAFGQFPAIATIVPEKGPVGTEVTISGVNFGTDPSLVSVYFGTAKAVVTEVSDTQLKAKVPGGATFKPVLVLTNGLQASSPRPFVVTSVNESLIQAGSFSEKTSFEVGGSPYEITVADLDMDGKTDLVAAGFKTITVLRNTATQGSFSASSFVRSDITTEGISITSIATGDIDGDGKPDIIATSASNNANTISVFRNNSIPGIITSSSFTRSTFKSGTNPQKVIVADLDNDGKPDVITANDNNSISILHNKTDRTGIAFDDMVVVNSTSPGTSETIAAADMDLDGKVDLVEYNLSNNVYTISVMHNQGAIAEIRESSFALAVSYGSGTKTDSDIAIGDLDNDGREDILANFGSANTISILKNLSIQGNFNASSFAPKVDFGTGSNPYCGKVIAEINGDGYPEVISTNRESNTWSILQNKGQKGLINTASFFPKVDFATGEKPTGIAAADLDGDGMTDIAVVSRDSRTADIYRNQVADAQIAYFSPQLGPPGTTFTMTGVNFGTDTLGIIVRINGSRASIKSATSTTVTAVVPKTASTGPLTVLKNGALRSNNLEFTVLPTTITGFTPSTVFAGDRLTIKGAGFSVGLRNNVVKINGVEATVLSCITGAITVEVPPEAKTGKITVITNGTATSVSTEDVVITTVSITGAEFPTLLTPGCTSVVSYGNPQQISRIKFLSRGVTQTNSEFREDQIEISPSNQGSFMIPQEYFNDPIGLQMRWQITDVSGNSIFRESFAYKKYAEGENIPDLNFGRGTENYQIISIPLELTNRSASNVFRVFGGFDSRQWRLFTFENQTPLEVKHDDVMMYPGFGYWFIAKDEMEINTGEGTAVQANSSQPFIMKLSPGWNLIGNPYNFSLSWDDVLSFNNRPQSIGTLRQFENGAFTINNTLGRFRGAFVRNAGNQDAFIKIPVTRTEPNSRKRSDEENDPQNWEVVLSVTDGRITNSLGGFGMRNGASEQADPWDEVTLPLPAGFSSFDLTMRGNIVKDIVPSADTYTWNGIIDSRDGITLSWDETLAHELWMEIPGHGVLIDMRSTSTLNVPAGTNAFNIIYGRKPDFLMIGDVVTNPLSRTSSMLRVPASFAAGSNLVQLSIIDSKGATQVLPVTNNYERGANLIEWQNDFTRLSRGLYILAITVTDEHSSQTFHRKFILE